MSRYKDRHFCIHADECANDDCMYWIDFETDTGALCLSLMEYKSERCGFIELDGDDDERQRK